MASNPSSPIYDEEAEGCAVACLILEPQHLGQVNLSPADFYIQDYRHLFEAVITLWQHSEEIDEKSVRREAGTTVGNWVLSKIMHDLPSSHDCMYYANLVRDASHRRQAIAILDEAVKAMKTPGSATQDAVDKVRLGFESLDGTGESSRLVRFSNITIRGSQPPTYSMDLLAANGNIAKDVTFESSDLGTQSNFKKKIREYLRINPVLPKNFDVFVHGLLQRAHAEDKMEDGTSDSDVRFWIREWFNTATEAEDSDDLQHGYINRDSALWFKSARLIAYLKKAEGTRTMDTSKLWAVIAGHGGLRSKLVKLGGKPERCWGLKKSFFDEKGPADQEQLVMGEQEDLSWLEENGNEKNTI